MLSGTSCARPSVPGMGQDLQPETRLPERVTTTVEKRQHAPYNVAKKGRFRIIRNLWFLSVQFCHSEQMKLFVSNASYNSSEIFKFGIERLRPGISGTMGEVV